jgi:RimJ/RimL family protein N-acetyltransferase
MTQQLRSRDVVQTALHTLLPQEVVLREWRRIPPVLRGPGVTLRDVQPSDAPALMAALSPDEVSRFIATPPSTQEAFESYIVIARDRRGRGESLTFAIVPERTGVAVGLFQLRPVEPHFAVTEWGFALSSAFWGKGLFLSAAPLVMDFAFTVLGARRIEARAAVHNARGNAALRKLGAVQEALLRQSWFRGDQAIDQVLWAIVADEWAAHRPSSLSGVH